MSESGFYANGYSYVPLIDDGADWSRKILADIGGLVGGLAGTSPAWGTMGEFIGDQVGYYLQNSQTIVANVQTFLAESSDWRSMASTITKMGGGGATLGSAGF